MMTPMLADTQEQHPSSVVISAAVSIGKQGRNNIIVPSLIQVLIYTLFVASQCIGIFLSAAGAEDL